MFTDLSKLIKKHKIIFEILNKDNKDSSRLVGGCVRDFIQTGVISNDIDISTIFTPEEVIKKLEEYRQTKECQNKYILTILDKDKQYGTIIAIFEDKKTKQTQRYEITTTRADIECFGRQANVVFCKDFKEDSTRRDFTINALYVDEQGKIFDFHNGIEDLKNNKIIFIGDAEKRIKEDYLRIVRFFRFATKFDNFNFDEQTLNIIKANKEGLLQLSRERIKSEIWKLLEYDNWFIGIKSLKDNDLIEEIFLIENPVIRGNFENFEANNIVKLFYFFNYKRKIMLELKEKLKFTREEKKLCDFLTDIWYLTNKGSELTLDAKIKIFSEKNKNYITYCFPLFNEEILSQIENFISRIKDLPITSQEIINLGYQGKELGEKIKLATKLWIESNFKAKKKDILKSLKEEENN